MHASLKAPHRFTFHNALYFQYHLTTLIEVKNAFKYEIVVYGKTHETQQKWKVIQNIFTCQTMMVSDYL